MSHTYESYCFHRMPTLVLLVSRSLRDAEEDGKLPLSTQVSRQKVPKFLAVVEEVQLRRILSQISKLAESKQCKIFQVFPLTLDIIRS